MSNPTSIPTSLTTTELNAPLDSRTVVKLIQDLYNILNPYVGMHVWIKDQAELVVVTLLASNSSTFKKQSIQSIQHNVFDAPDDGGIYSRINNQWVDISQYLFPVILDRFYYGYVLGSAVSSHINNITTEAILTGIRNSTIKYMDIELTIGLLIIDLLIKYRSWLVAFVPQGYKVLRFIDHPDIYGPFEVIILGSSVASGANGLKTILIDNKTYKIYGQRWPYSDGSGYSGTKFKVTRI